MPQPQPFMREKSLWIIISLLALALLLVIFNQLRQDQALKELRQPAIVPEAGKPAAIAVDSVTTTIPTTVPTANSSATTTIGTATTTAPEMHLEVNRRPFGSLTSPDGRWRLDHQKTEEPQNGVVTVTHRLILRSLVGQADQVVYTAKEYIKDTFEAVQGKPLAANWNVVGWSADGKKVYYVATPYMEGLGGAYPDGEAGAESLHEVVVESGAHTKLYVSSGSFPSHGILDVIPQKNIVLTTDFVQVQARIFAMELGGKNKRVIFQGRAGQDVSAVVLNGDGTRVAIVTNESDPSEPNGGAYLYRVYGYDLVRNTPTSFTSLDVNGAGNPVFHSYQDGKWQAMMQFSFMEGDVKHVFNAY